MKAKTADERYVLSLYDAAQAAGEIDTPFNRYEIGQRAGLKPKAVDAICKLLVQANLIKKYDEDTVYLTKNGESLALSLLEQ